MGDQRVIDAYLGSHHDAAAHRGGGAEASSPRPRRPRAGARRAGREGGGRVSTPAAGPAPTQPAEQPADQPGTRPAPSRTPRSRAAGRPRDRPGRPLAPTRPAAGDALLRADEVVAGYVPGVNILNGCDFYVNDGELVGIIGPNGAGKSTLLKAIFGLVKVRQRHRSQLRGEDITGLKANQLVAQGRRLRAADQQRLPEPDHRGEPADGASTRRPRSSSSASSSSPGCSPPWATAARSGPARCPAASGRWSRWAGR